LGYLTQFRGFFQKFMTAFLAATDDEKRYLGKMIVF